MRSRDERRAVWCAVVAVAALAGAAQAGQGWSVPVTVEEPAGIARSGEPVSGGIPLPAGTFKPGAAKLALFEGDRAVPVQVTELVVGPAGDVRWVLLDYQLDLKAGETRTLTLRPGEAAKPATALKVAETAQGVQIDTGKIAFTVSKTRPFGLVEGVTAGGKPVVTGGVVSYTNGLDGKRYAAAVPDTVKVLYAGPLRVTVEVRGHFGDDTATKLRFATYLTAWANRSDILVKHSLINSRDDTQYFVQIKGSQIELWPAARPATVTVGVDKAMQVDLPSPAAQAGRKDVATAIHQGLLDTAAAPCRLMQGDAALWTGKGAAGWLKAGPVWVHDRLFASDPPRYLGVADGTIVLDAAPAAFEGTEDRQGLKIGGRPSYSVDEYRWLFDCTHHSSEYRIDFAATDDPAALSAQAKAADARVWGMAPGAWISNCQVLGSARFGTLDDEKACHRLWNWQVERREPTWRTNPTRFVGWEDNHYESEADSAEAMLLMFLRTGQRGYLDEAEAWVRYHADVQAWRTEGWVWKDGGLWWPQGGPPGNKPVRPRGGNRTAAAPRGSLGERSLSRIAIAKGCYCHYYGAGLVDWFCLTGDRDPLDAAVDDCETKYNDYTWAHPLTPGKTGIPDHRGFGRGFYVAVRTWMVLPQNEMLTKLVTLCGRTLAQMPPAFMDERGVVASAGGRSSLSRFLTPGVKKYMDENGITVEGDVTFSDKDGQSWRWKYLGGTWEICYIQDAADLYAQETGDVDAMDYAIAAGEFAAKYMLSPVAKQTWYITALDIPRKGDIWDDWKYDGRERNADGEGQAHSGWYTCFFPDACARAFSWTGERHLLEKAREFWSYGNRREYQTKALLPANRYAWHVPPKSDSVLSTARLFYEASHPRKDAEAPAAVTDLSAKLLGDGKAEVTFTAPADQGGGRVARYQVKAAPLPIAAYEDWDYARDDGLKRNWWRAANLEGAPAPSAAGRTERFQVTGLPEGNTLYFALRAFDDSSNRSALSNVVEMKK